MVQDSYIYNGGPIESRISMTLTPNPRVRVRVRVGKLGNRTQTFKWYHFQ